MRLRRILCICFAILGAADAFIEFAKSRIYDEKDFLKTRTIALNEFCSNGCNIYASIPKDSSLAKWIYIVNEKKRTSLSKANSKEKNGRKKPFATKGDKVNFENDINGLKSVPLLIWVVQQDAPFFDSVEIYDAADLNRKAAPAQLLTVMSAEPFVLTTNTSGPMASSAFTAGFDAFQSADDCARVLRQENSATYQDLKASIRSPLFTLVYDKVAYPKSKIALRVSKEDVATFDLAKPMFATSPGYIGCSVKEGDSPYGGVYTKTFRSSLYKDETVFNFKSNDPVALVLSGDISTDIDHAVTVAADGIVIWTAVIADAETQVAVTATELTINWTRNPDDLNEYFMVRVEQDHGSSKTTTFAPEEPGKTTQMEPEEFKNTTLLPDQHQTTSLEPEMPKTTAVVPAALEQTTSVEPVEEDRTTRLGPSMTTTSDNESEETDDSTVAHEKTTSAERDPEPNEPTTAEQDYESEKTTPSESVPEDQKTATSETVLDPIQTTTAQADLASVNSPSTVSQPQSEKTTIPEHQPELIITTVADPEVSEFYISTMSEPVAGRTTSEAQELKKATTSPTTSLDVRIQTIPTFHPKASSSSTSTVHPTTSGASYDPLLLPIGLAAVMLL